MDWYQIQNIEKVDSPSLIVYPERVNENIDRFIKMAGSADNVRPHVKTNKMAEVCSLMMLAGINKFKCATIAEAEMLGMIKAPDVLIAHQPVGPKQERLLKLVTAFPDTHFTCIIDNFSTAKELSELFTANGQRIQAYIDLNIGMNRSGIIPENALQLFTVLPEKNNKLRGIVIQPKGLEKAVPLPSFVDTVTLFAFTLLIKILP